MKKFTLISENYTFGNFSLSYNDLIEYQKLVKSELDILYTEKIELEGFIFVARQSFDSPNRIKSIINYANSNIMLCSWIVENFNCNSKSELLNVIQNHSAELFLPTGKYFNDVIEKLIITESYGIKNEEYAANYLMGLLQNKQIQTTVLRTETDCRDDLILGIDLYFMYNGNKITCQVKPFKSISELGDKLQVTSSGKLKPYKVNYLIFVDFKKDKAYLFKNKGAEYKDKVVTLPKSSYISPSLF